MGEMSVLNKTGDTKKVWDANVPAEVEDARRSFDYFTKEKKYAAFKVDKNKSDSRGEKITVFDPHLEAIMFVPAIVGG